MVSWSLELKNNCTNVIKNWIQWRDFSFPKHPRTIRAHFQCSCCNNTSKVFERISIRDLKDEYPVSIQTLSVFCYCFSIFTCFFLVHPWSTMPQTKCRAKLINICHRRIEIAWCTPVLAIKLYVNAYGLHKHKEKKILLIFFLWKSLPNDFQPAPRESVWIFE